MLVRRCRRGTPPSKGNGLRSVPVQALALIVLLLFSSCAGTHSLPYDVALLRTSEEGLTPATAALLQEAKRHAKYRITAAALGGTFGVGALAISGQNPVYAVPAAVLGAEAGYAFGSYLEARDSRINMDEEKVVMLVAAARRDEARYEQDLANAEKATNETAELIRRAGQERAPAAADGAYASAARNLAAISQSLQLLTREQAALEKLILSDAQEVRDSQQLGDTRIQSRPLFVAAKNVEVSRERMKLQHRKVAALANALPPRERPLIEATPG